jgi:hypothetical protein
MGAMKEVMIDCLDSGVVPVEAKRIGEWADQLGDNAKILNGMPMKHRYEGRYGEIDVDVLPVSVAFRVGELLPDTYDELGWMIDSFLETRL